MKTRWFLVCSVETEEGIAEAADVDAVRLNELASVDASLLGLLATLLSFKTLPHLLGLVVFSCVFYALADGSAGFAAVGFTSLAVGYAATAVLSNIEAVKSWTLLQPWGENRPTLQKRLLLSSRILALPFGLAIAFAVAFVALTSESAADWLALGLAGLFVLWAVAQGRSFAGWASSIAARKSPQSSKKTGKGYVALATLFGIVVAFGAVCITAYSSLHATSFTVQPKTIDLVVFTGIAIAAFALMNTITWRERSLAMADKALRRFHFRWSLLIHLFVTWHLLTVYRHAAMNPGTVEVYIEEVALMIFTVFMGIWSLTSRGFGSELKLLNTDNALPWGLAFGYAYAGSVAMISSVVEDFQTVMLLGHVIASLTGIMMHRSVMKNLLVRHDETIEIQRLVKDIEPATDPEQATKANEIEPSPASANQEDWDGDLNKD
jgi:hypothetical protein